jgi:hypothetical protein
MSKLAFRMRKMPEPPRMRGATYRDFTSQSSTPAAGSQEEIQEFFLTPGT